MTRTFDRSRALQGRFHDRIPGGTHTYAKGDDQYPESMPVILTRGQGCRVWDVDGNDYIEYGMGLRSVSLGHGYPAVVDAVRARTGDGTNFTRPTLLELDAADALAGVVPGAEMVKFAKNGSDATTAAVRLARAATGRDIVAICHEASFLSVDDWFIGVSPMDAGIPDAMRELTVRFHYNDLADAERVFAEHPGRIAAIVMEAANVLEPVDGFLEGIQALCRRHGAILVFDEMITGFRWHLGGAQSVYGVIPDLAAFGKAMGNGFPIAALTGRRDLMELGGLRHDGPRTFLLSTTHGAEPLGLAAAIAVIDTYEREDVIGALDAAGRRLASGVEEVVRAKGLADHFQVLGRPCNLVYAARDADGQPSQAFRTLVLQELMRNGVLAPSLVVSYAHDEPAIDRTVEAIEGMLTVYGRALEDGVERHLVGRPVQPVMRARNGLVFSG